MRACGWGSPSSNTASHCSRSNTARASQPANDHHAAAALDRVAKAAPTTLNIMPLLPGEAAAAALPAAQANSLHALLVKDARQKAEPLKAA